MTVLAAGTGDSSTELVLFGILFAVAGLVLLAHVVRIPYPIMLTLGGIAIGFFPGVPDIELAPELVLLIFLPPLLYGAAFFTSLRDLRANAGPISLLAFGLVLATVFTVAGVAHWVVGLSWEASLVLGAVLSPTDPVAATAIAGRLGTPRRITVITEGESLVNDATALIAFKFAVAAAVTGGFSLLDAGFEFLYSVAGGVAVGLLVAKLAAELRRPLDAPPVEITISLVTPYVAYLPADAAGLSGVVAAVTAGIYLGIRAPELIAPTTRLQATAVWEILIYLANAALFVLIGLQLPAILDDLRGQESGATLLLWALAIAAAVTLTRLAWVFPFTYLPRLLVRRVRDRDPAPPASWVLVLGWSGLRGAVSLAAALAVPFAVDSRDLIIYLTFTTVVFTVVGQGLTLPLLIRALGVVDDGEQDRKEENKARWKASEAALRRLDELRDEDWVREDTAGRVQAMYEFRSRRIGARFDDGDDGAIEERSMNYQRLLRELLVAQRRAIVALRDEGRIGSDIMRRIERDLDLEETRLELDREGVA